VNVKYTKFQYTGLCRPFPRRGRITNFEYRELDNAEPQTAQLLDVAGVVILELGEGKYTFQWTGTQGGDNYLSFTNVQIDTPLKQEVIEFDSFRDEDAGEAKLRAAIGGLARRICFSADRHWVGNTSDKRLICEESERLIAEQLFKALVRQGGIDPEEWEEWRSQQKQSAAGA